jgi:hypothetical protein
MAGLNKVDGEDLPGLGKGRVASVEKWADIEDMLAIAAQVAADKFHEAGAPKDISLTEDNILVQEFHLASKVVFTFWLPINGADHFYHYTYTLGPAMLAELAVTGKWPAIYAMPADAMVN